MPRTACTLLPIHSMIVNSATRSAAARAPRTSDAHTTMLRSPRFRLSAANISAATPLAAKAAMHATRMVSSTPLPSARTVLAMSKARTAASAAHPARRPVRVSGWRGLRACISETGRSRSRTQRSYGLQDPRAGPDGEMVLIAAATVSGRWLPWPEKRRQDRSAASHAKWLFARRSPRQPARLVLESASGGSEKRIGPPIRSFGDAQRRPTPSGRSTWRVSGCCIRRA